MAPLVDLPTELLLSIIETSNSLVGDQYYVKKLRATCKTLHEKLDRYFGRKCHGFKEFYLELDGLVDLVELSDARLTRFLESITIIPSTWSNLASIAISNDWGDPPRGYPGDDYRDDMVFNKAPFRQDAYDYLGDVLEPDPAKFPRLKEFHIYQHGELPNLCSTSLVFLQNRWTMLVSVMLAAVLSRAGPMEVIRVGDYAGEFAAHVSILEHIFARKDKLDHLERLHLDLTVEYSDTNCVENSEHSDLATSGDQKGPTSSGRLLGQIIKAAPRLKELYLGLDFCAKGPLLFQHFSENLPKTVISRLTIHNSSIKMERFEKVLRGLKPTLEALTLHGVNLIQGTNFASFLRDELKLKEVCFSYVMVESRTTNFDNIHFERPEESSYFMNGYELPDWVVMERPQLGYDEQRSIRLGEEDGDDIGYWLGEIDRICTWDFIAHSTKYTVFWNV